MTTGLCCSASAGAQEKTEIRQVSGVCSVGRMFSETCDKNTHVHEGIDGNDLRSILVLSAN